MQQVEQEVWGTSYKGVVRKSGKLLMQRLPGIQPLGQEVGGTSSLPHIQETGRPHGQEVGETPQPAGEWRRHPHISRFSIYATVPPAADSHQMFQRADDVSAILRMLSAPQTNAVVLSGEPGAGKSTLAGLVYQYVQSLQYANEADQSAVGAPHRGEPLGFSHVVWLSLGPNATLPDVIAAMLSGMKCDAPGFLLLRPEQQMALLVQALRRPHEGALIVLDQFEEVFQPAWAETRSFARTGTRHSPYSPERSEGTGTRHGPYGDDKGAKDESAAPTGLPGRGAVALFLEMLRDADIGTSRVLLTSCRSLNGSRNGYESRMRSYLVSRISIPEGMALLQQRGVQGSHSELSLIWQRCGGHVFSLVLFSILINLSGFSLSYLLNSPDYALMWNGEVTRNLMGTMYNFLNPLQRTLMRALCLFAEPVPLEAVATAIVGGSAVEDGAPPQRADVKSAPTDWADRKSVGADWADRKSAPTGWRVSPYEAFKAELGALVEMSLVQEQSRSIGQHTYFLHPLLRDYTVEHYLEGRGPQSSGFPVPQTGYTRASHLPTDVLGVAAPPDPMGSHPEARQIALAAGHMRVATYYAHLAQEYCPPREQRTGLADVEPIVAMIQHLCLGWHWQEAYNLLCAEGLHESMLQWGAFNTLIGLYTAMLPPLGVVTRHDFGEMCGELGLLYGRLGEGTQSWNCYEQALVVFREMGDGYAEAVTLANEGELFRGAGEWEKARSNFEQALTLNVQYGDEHLQSVILHNLGLLYQARKDYTTALRCYVESLKLAHTMKERYDEGMILSNMGFLLFEQGHLPDAVALLSYAVQLRQSLHDPTVSAVIDFLSALEQKMGSEAFARLRSSSSANYNLGTDDLISRLLGSGTARMSS